MSDISADLPPRGDKLTASGKKRRDFLYVATGTLGAVAAAGSIWPLVDTMNPAADVRALAKIEVDLSSIPRGARITVQWAQKPIFIDHRTERQIANSIADDNNPDLIDPALDSERVQRAEWLVQIGICTHLGCIPGGQEPGDLRGDWDGWYCACHGSVYDGAGRVRKGPAPRNLDLPPYQFLSDTLLQIGTA